MLPLQSWAATKLLEKSWGQRMLKQVSQLYYYVSVIVSSILKWFALSYCFTVACFSVYLQPLIFLWVNNVDEIKQWKNTCLHWSLIVWIKLSGMNGKGALRFDIILRFDSELHGISISLPLLKLCKSLPPSKTYCLHLICGFCCEFCMDEISIV